MVRILPEEPEKSMLRDMADNIAKYFGKNDDTTPEVTSLVQEYFNAAGLPSLAPGQIGEAVEIAKETGIHCALSMREYIGEVEDGKGGMTPGGFETKNIRKFKSMTASERVHMHFQNVYRKCHKGVVDYMNFQLGYINAWSEADLTKPWVQKDIEASTGIRPAVLAAMATLNMLQISFKGALMTYDGYDQETIAAELKEGVYRFLATVHPSRSTNSNDKSPKRPRSVRKRGPRGPKGRPH
jgi:hypothetical protein